MNRWQALVEVVKSFNERGATGLAFGAVCAFAVAAPALLYGLIAILGWPKIPLDWLNG